MLYFGLANILFFLRYTMAGAHGLSRHIYFLVLIGLLLFSAFRYEVGCDWSGYYYQYLSAGNIDWSNLLTGQRDPIWWSILGWIREMDLPYPVANVVSSVVFFVGVHVLARRQPDPLGFLVLLLPVLIINMPMSSIRQGAAIGLVCIAFTSFVDRRPIWFTFWTICAAGFHSSAIIFLFLLPFATGSYSKKALFMAVVLAIPGIVLLLGSDDAELANSRYVQTGRDAFGAVFRLSVLFLSALYFFLFIRKKWKRTFPKDYSLASIGAIGMLLVFLLLPVSSVVGDRFGYYLIPIQVMIFARIPFLPFRYGHSLHSALPYFGLLTVFFVWTQISWHFQQCYIPYNSWLFGFPDS